MVCSVTSTTTIPIPMTSSFRETGYKLSNQCPIASESFGDGPSIGMSSTAALSSRTCRYSGSSWARARGRRRRRAVQVLGNSRAVDEGQRFVDTHHSKVAVHESEPNGAFAISVSSSVSSSADWRSTSRASGARPSFVVDVRCGADPLDDHAVVVADREDRGTCASDTRRRTAGSDSRVGRAFAFASRVPTCSSPVRRRRGERGLPNPIRNFVSGACPVYVAPCRLKYSVAPSGAAIQTMCGIDSAMSRRSASARNGSSVGRRARHTCVPSPKTRGYSSRPREGEAVPRSPRVFRHLAEDLKR